MTSPVVSTRLSAGTSDGRGNSLMIGVADEHIGAVVGRGGRNIMEISQVCIIGLGPLICFLLMKSSGSWNSRFQF